MKKTNVVSMYYHKGSLNLESGFMNERYYLSPQYNYINI